MRETLKKSLKETKDYVMIAFGLLLYALAWNLFVFPHGIAGGGASGVAAIVMYATQGMLSPEWEQFFSKIGMYSQDGGVPISVTFLLVNVVLMLISMKDLGKKFTLRTLYGVIVLTLWYWVPFRDLYNTYVEPFPEFDPFMSVIMGGALVGIGIGISFSHGGSSGGTDIVVKLMNKYRNMAVGRAMLFCDFIIISSNGILPGKGLESITYGLIMLFVMSLTVDMYLNGLRQSVQFFIFSNHYEEIAEAITTQVRRGVTLIDGQGWYSKKKTKVITVLARKSESSQIFHAVKEIDPNALISQSAALGVYGEGFNSIDETVKPQRKKRV